MILRLLRRGLLSVHHSTLVLYPMPMHVLMVSSFYFLSSWSRSNMQTCRALMESISHFILTIRPRTMILYKAYVLWYHPRWVCIYLHIQRLVWFYSNIDSSLSDLVEQVLSLGAYYTAIFAFIEHRSHHNYGLVNHALCAAMREILKVRLSNLTLFCFPNLIYGCRTTKTFYSSLITHSILHPPSPCKKSGSMSIQPCIHLLSYTSLSWS